MSGILINPSPYRLPKRGELSASRNSKRQSVCWRRYGLTFRVAAPLLPIVLRRMMKFSHEILTSLPMSQRTRNVARRKRQAFHITPAGRNVTDKYCVLSRSDSYRGNSLCEFELTLQLLLNVPSYLGCRTTTNYFHWLTMPPIKCMWLSVVRNSNVNCGSNQTFSEGSYIGKVTKTAFGTDRCRKSSRTRFVEC
jgi:hypothetical protein